METLRAFPKARKRIGNVLKTLGAFPKSFWGMRLLGYSSWLIRSDLKLVWGGVGWFRVHRGGWFGNVEGGLRSLRLI